MRRRKKLYVWTDFQTDHTPGLAFAIAFTLNEAIDLVKAAHGPLILGDYKHWGELHIHQLTESVAYAESGGG